MKEISRAVLTPSKHSLPTKEACDMDNEVVKKLGNSTIRIVPPVLTDEERERVHAEIKRAVWEIVKRKRKGR